MHLKKPLVVFDLETTGTWIEKDKIIEIALVKLHPDGRQESYDRKIYPGIPIPARVTELTGIRDADVKEAPTFKQVAQEVLDFIGDADVGGFNIDRFDLPLLKREFAEVGISFDWAERTVYDAQKVYHLNEKRDLSAAYQFYCQKNLEQAHSALADTQATVEILKKQIEQYGDGESIASLSDFEYQTTAEFYDPDRRFRWWNGKLYLMFGKYAGKYTLEELVQRDRGYLEWILSADFNQDVKLLVESALSGRFPQVPEKG